MSGGKKTPVNEMLLIPEVAKRLVYGHSTTQIADALNIGFNTVKRIAKLDETKAVIQEVYEQQRKVAIAVLVNNTADLVPEAVRALKEKLKENDLGAVKLVFQAIGLGTEESLSKDKGGGSLTIVMPGAHAEKPALEVESESGTEVEVGFGETGSDDFQK